MAYLNAVYGASTEYLTALANAESSTQALRGRAIRSLSERVNRLTEGARVVTTSVENTLRALRSYAAQTFEIHQRALTVESNVESALANIRVAASRIEEVSQRIGVWNDYSWDTPPASVMPKPYSRLAIIDAVIGDPTMVDAMNREQWAHATRAWQGAYESILMSKKTWRSLVAERKGYERVLMASIESTELAAFIPSGAGSASISISRIMRQSLTPDRPWESAPLQSLISGELSPALAADAWDHLVSSGADIDALLGKYCFELANVDGIPFWAQDRAGRVALRNALESDAQLLEAFRRMGFAHEDRSIDDFRIDLESLQGALAKADKNFIPSQLVEFGRHDGVVTAGISFGNLDTAPVVGVFVSGMNSNVRQAEDSFGAFNAIRRRIPESAMVTWLGYRAPGIGEEMLQGRAERGRFSLASFIDGISLTGNGDSARRIVLMGHSYGTNVAAEALKITERAVDAIVSIGSAGLSYGTQPEQLHVSEMYATHAEGDNIAPVGRVVQARPGNDGGGFYEARVDPRSLPGVQLFSSEKSKDGKAVTMHNLVNPVDWGPVQFLADLDGNTKEQEIGYLNPESTTVFKLGDIMTKELR